MEKSEKLKIQKPNKSSFKLILPLPPPWTQIIQLTEVYPRQDSVQITCNLMGHMSTWTSLNFLGDLKIKNKTSILDLQSKLV